MQRDLKNQLQNKINAEIIFHGGDSILAISDSPNIEKEIFKIHEEFQKFNATFSCGLGKSPQEAYLALKIAKGTGKNNITKFNGTYEQ